MAQWDRKEGGDGFSLEHDLLAVFVWGLRMRGYAEYRIAPKCAAHPRHVSSLLAVSRTESLLLLAHSPAGELWMRWKAHTDIWLIRYRAKMPLKGWYSSLGRRAFSPPPALPASPQRRTAPRDRRRGREESYHRGGWTDKIWGRQWGWQTNRHGHWGQPVGRNTVWVQIVSCCLAGLLQHVPRRIPTETSILCQLIAWTARQRQTRDSARCVLLILEFTTSSRFHNVSPPCGLAYKAHGKRAR